MFKYEIIMWWSEIDSTYLVEVPELPGCMADGDTPEAALAMAQEVISLWIETAESLGRSVPEPKGRRLMYA